MLEIIVILMILQLIPVLKLAIIKRPKPQQPEDLPSAFDRDVIICNSCLKHKERDR